MSQINRHNIVAPLNKEDKGGKQKENEKDRDIDQKQIDDEDIQVVAKDSHELIADIEAERDKILAMEKEHQDKVEEMINY